MSVVIPNYLVKTSPPTFTVDTPNPGVSDIHGSQFVRLVDGSGIPLTINDDTAEMSDTIGTQADSQSTQGGVGTLSAKLRLVTSQMNTLTAQNGGTTDAASSPGGTGTISGKLRGISSQLNALTPKSNASIISKTTACTIGGGVASDTKLLMVHIGTALTGTCVIAGFADSDGTGQSYTLAAASVGMFDFYGAVNSAAALTVTCSNAADDNKVIVLWAANT